MPIRSQHKKPSGLDYLLYLMAGTVIAVFCFSALLWLSL